MVHLPWDGVDWDGAEGDPDGMTPFRLLPLVVLSACLFAGVFGALHDQISFTVSPDYFYHFKFEQFEIPEHWQGRWGAAIVGWKASWWMGVLIGIPLGLIGLIMPSPRSYLFHCLMAFLVVLATTLAVGLGGLVYAWQYLTLDDVRDYVLPRGVTDRWAFHRAGIMHESSYLGGFIGIATGAIYLVAARLWRHWRSPKRMAAEPLPEPE